MFVSKKGDIVVIDDGVYQIIDQIEFENQEYVVLMSVTSDVADMINHKSPMYVAKELVKEEELFLDFIEDEKLIEKIKNLFDFEDMGN